MLKKVAAVCAVLMLVSPLIQAQNGCVDSPENPTALLAVVGGAGAMVVRWFNRRGR
jgi:XrtJ-associated TM-motif-TM protein